MKTYTRMMFCPVCRQVEPHKVWKHSEADGKVGVNAYCIRLFYPKTPKEHHCNNVLRLEMTEGSWQALVENNYL